MGDVLRKLQKNKTFLTTVVFVEFENINYKSSLN